jgi:uncharacterized repeat protein (TIGR02543 family)
MGWTGTFNGNTYWIGGAGGGAGAAATAATSSGQAGIGGAGASVSWINSAAQSNLGVGVWSSGAAYFAGGGGGGTAVYGSAGSGGVGGGGAGGALSQAGTNATANTGGGGGGGGYYSDNTSPRAGDGASGVVVLRYSVTPILSYNASDANSFDTTTSNQAVNDMSPSGANDGWLSFQSNTQIPGYNTSAGAWTFSGGASGVGPYIDVNSTISTTPFATYGMTIDFEADFGSSADNWERIMDFSEGGLTNDNILIARIGTSNDLAFEIYNGVNSQTTCTYAGGIPVNSGMNRWTITVDGTNCNIYKNNSLVYNRAYSAKPMSGINLVDNYIGRSNWVDASFEGSIRSLNIYVGAIPPNSLQPYVYKTVTNDSFVGGATTVLQTRYTAGAIRLPSPASRAGYIFTGWFSSTSFTERVGGSGDLFSPTGTTTLYAGWRTVDSSVTGNLIMNFDATNLTSLPSAATSASSIYPAVTPAAATSVAGVTRDTANSPGAMVMDSGTAGSAVSFGTGGQYNITGALTYETWIKFSSLRTGASQWNVIASHWFADTSGTGATDWHFGIYGGKLQINAGASSIGVGSKVWTSSDVGVWYHIGFSIDASNNLQIYVNGRPDGAATPSIVHAPNASALMWIGDGRTPNNSVRMQGYVSRARLYNAALSKNQLRYNYNIEAVTYSRTATYDLTYSAGPNGTGSDVVENYSSGSSATLKNASAGFSRSGYVIGGWTTSSSSGASQTNALSSALSITSDVTLYPVWASGTNTITYEYNGATGGNGTVSSNYTTGGTAITLPTPTKTGYTFAGWYRESTFDTAVTGTQTPSSSYTIYAKWTAATYTLTYTYNGATGGNTTSSDTYTTGGTAITLPTPTKTGYTFAGWYAESNFVTQKTGTQTPSASATLYAKWANGTYTLTYTYNGATGGNGSASASYTTGGTAITLPTPTKTGYTFAGWYAESNFATSITGTQTPSTDATIYAKWTALNYTLTYNSNSATGGSVPVDASNYNINGNASVAGNSGSLVRTGYTFAGWTLNSGGTGTVYNSGDALVFGSANQILYAKWTANTYTISYNTNGATGTQANASDSYTTAGTAVTLSAVGTMAKTGYNFAGWSTTANGSAIAGTYTTSVDITLYAVWNIKSINVTYSKGTASSATFLSFPANTASNYGTRVTLSNNVDSSVTYSSQTYAFVGWSDGTSIYQSGVQYILGATDVTLTAIWTPAFGVRYIFNGGTAANGTSAIDAECLVAGNLCTDGQSIITNAAPTRDGYTFTGWTDQSSNAIAAGASFTVNINSYLLYAGWQANNYTVTYVPNGGATTPTQAALHYGDTFTLAAAPTRTGYTFAGWSDGTSTLGAGATYTVGLSAITLTAQWTPRTYAITYDWNGGTGTSVGLTLSGATDHVKDGYQFGGWALTIGGDAVASPFVATSNTTLYAIWGQGSYTLTFEPNYGVVANSTTSVANGTSTALPTLTRDNFVFDGWYTASTGGTKVGNGGASYTPAASRQLYARWIQSSLYGVINNLSRVSTITASGSVDSTYSGTNGGSGVSVTVPRNSLPTGTVVNLDLITDTSYAQSLLTGSNNYILSLAVSWIAADETVPNTSNGTSISLTITNANIRAGAKIYSVQNGVATLLGTAVTNGTLTVELTQDPSIYVVQTVTSTPRSVASTVTATSGTVTWLAPLSDGGSTLTNYTVTLNTGATCTTATLTCTFNTLTTGTSYTATIYATNSVGNSATVTTTFTPAAAPASSPSTPTTPVTPTPPAPKPPVTPEVPSKPVIIPVPVVQAVAQVLANNVPVLAGTPLIKPILFNSDSASLDASDRAAIKLAADQLVGKQGTLFVTGFVKYVGRLTPEIKKLAQSRAKNVAMALAKLGVKVTVGYLGYGPHNTKSPKDTDRKVELRWVEVKTTNS